MTLKFTEVVISPAYSSSTLKSTLPIKGKGLNWIMSAIQWLPTTVDFPPVKYEGTPTLRLKKTHGEINCIATEGNDITFTIELMYDQPADVTGTWNIITSEDGYSLASVPTEALVGMDSDAENTVDSFDPKDRLTVVADADIGTKTGSWTIPQGQKSVTVTVSTVDDAVFTGGANTYKVARLSVTNSQGLPTHGTGTILIEDASPPSICDGALSVKGKIHSLLPEEKLMNANEAAPLELLIGDKYGGFHLDDIPLVELSFEPIPTSFKMQTGGIDPNGVPYRYRIILQVAD
jgi:hypothetical protein